MQLARVLLPCMTSYLSLALRLSSRNEQSLRLYVYNVSVRDFDIDPEAIKKYERWLDMSAVPVPHHIEGMETDIEHNHVLHNPDVGLAAVAKKAGVRVWKPEDANAFWLPISNVMLCASTWERGKQHYPIISKVAYTCDAYVSVLQWLFKQESWKRNGGADHVFDIDQVPMGFGGLWTPQHQDDNATHRMLDRALANSIIISIEDRSADAIQRIKARKEIIVPYFVDRNKYWVRPSQHKTALVSFVGSAEVECHVENCNTWNSLTIRERVKGELANATDAVLVDLGGDRLPSTFDWSSARNVYSNSLFCIAPAGDSFTSARFFAVLMSTCIPVSINNYAQLPFEDTLPKKWTDFIVDIKEADMLQNGVLHTLRKLAQDKALIEEMQGKGRKARWWLSYARSKDTIDGPSAQRMILEEIANRVGVRWDGNRLLRELRPMPSESPVKFSRVATGACADKVNINFSSPTGELGAGLPGLLFSDVVSPAPKPVDLLMTVSNSYQAFNALKNGARGNLVQVNLADNLTTDLTLSFVDSSKAPVEVGRFFLSVLDIDGGNSAYESVSIKTDSFTRYFLSDTSSIIVTEEGGITTFKSSAFGDSSTNPTNSDKLDDDQTSKGVGLFFENKTSQVTFTIQAANAWTGRNIFFTGLTQIACPAGTD